MSITRVLILVVLSILCTNVSSGQFSKQQRYNLDEGILGCRLKWKSYSTGNELPTTLIKLTSTSTIDGKNDLRATQIKRAIARAKIFGNWTLGTIDHNGFASFFNKNPSQQLRYEILTNPDECVTRWIPNSVRNNATILRNKVPLRESSLKWIGQTSVNGRWLPCEISEDQRKCIYVNVGHGTTTQVAAKKFDKLSSYTGSLGLRLRNITYSIQREELAVDFTGNEIFVNPSGAEVTHTVNHTKSLTKTSVWTLDVKWNLTIGVAINFAKLSTNPSAPDLKFLYTSGDVSTTRTTFSREVVLSASREVIIPPFTSVESCTKVLIKYFWMIIMSEGEVNAKGYPPSKIIELLKNSGHQGPFRTEGDNVIIPLNGSVQGSAPVNSELTVLPTNYYKMSSAPSPCAIARRQVSRYSRLDGKFDFNEKIWNDLINSIS